MIEITFNTIDLPCDLALGTHLAEVSWTGQRGQYRIVWDQGTVRRKIIRLVIIYYRIGFRLLNSIIFCITAWSSDAMDSHS